jgi:hypothetical protein
MVMPRVLATANRDGHRAQPQDRPAQVTDVVQAKGEAPLGEDDPDRERDPAEEHLPPEDLVGTDEVAQGRNRRPAG